jgi:hypothetical protein
MSEVIKFPEGGRGPRDKLEHSRGASEAYQDGPSPKTVPTSVRNSRLRKARDKIWRTRDAATRYWRTRLAFEHAISLAQTNGVPESYNHPDLEDCTPATVQSFRAALMLQVLTPAPEANSVKWKQAVLAGREHRYAGVPVELIERAIADDLAWLAAHPVQKGGRRRSEVSK